MGDVVEKVEAAGQGSAFVEAEAEANRIAAADAADPEDSGPLDWTAAAVRRGLPTPILSVGQDAPLVPWGEVGLIAGAGGLGKSTLALQVAVRAAGSLPGSLMPVLSNGDPLAVDAGVLAVAGGPVVVVTYEDAAPWLHWRASHAARWFDGATTGRPASKNDPLVKTAAGSGSGPYLQAVMNPGLLSVAVLERPIAAPAPRERWGLPEKTGAWTRVFDRAGEIGAKLVIIDPAALALEVGQGGYSPGPVGAFVSALRREAVTIGCAILVVAHTNKAARREGVDAGAEAVSGSHAWIDRVRSVLLMAADKLRVVKANYAPRGAEWEIGAVPHKSGRPVAFEERKTKQADTGASDGKASNGSGID